VGPSTVTVKAVTVTVTVTVERARPRSLRDWREADAYRGGSGAGTGFLIAGTVRR
jgi:hypothetical protein